MRYRIKRKTIILIKIHLVLVIILVLPPFPSGVTVVCTFLVESLLDEPYKSICNLMAKTIHSIAVHYFPDKWPYLLHALLGRISLNSNPC